MAEPTLPIPAQPPDAEEAFVALVLQYLDGACAADDRARLRGELEGAAGRRDVFVRLCRLHGELAEALAPQREQLLRKGRLGHDTLPAQPATGGGHEAAPVSTGVLVQEPPPGGEPDAAPPAERGGANDTVMLQGTPDDTVHGKDARPGPEAPGGAG